MRFRFEVPSLILTMALVVVSCGSREPTLLQMKFEPSKSYRLSVRKESTVTDASKDGSGPSMKPSSSFVYIVRAERIYENGDTGLSITTEKAESSVVPAFSAALQGQTFGARVSPSGRFLEFSGTDALREHVKRSISDKEIDRLLSSVSDEALAQTFNSIFDVWPSVPVAPRDTWSRDSIFNPGANAYQFTEFRLAAIDATGARIKFTSKFHAENSADSPTVGEARGELQLSTADGVLRSLREESDFTMKLTDELTLRTKTTTYVTFVPL